MTGCYRPLLDSIGLTYSQYAVMLVLWEHESVTLGTLCARVQLDTGTLSPLLKRLEAEGLLDGAVARRTSGRCSSPSPSAGA